MRLRVVFAALALAASVAAYGQELNPSFKSDGKAAALTEKEGTAMRVERLSSETFSGMSQFLEVAPSVVTDLRSGESLRFVSFTTGQGSGSGKTVAPEYTSTLDEDEIPAFLETIDYIAKAVSSESPKSPYVSISFRSRDGLEFGAFYGKGMMGGSSWNVSVRHTKYLANPTVVFTSTKRLGQIRETVARAQTSLASE